MSGKKRIAVLGGVAAILAALAIFFVARGRRHGVPIASGQQGSALTHVPAPPQVPQLVHDGVRLTGFVVDGAGLPVTGAEVSADVEKGGTERALSVGSGSGSGSGSGAAPAVSVAAPTTADGRFALDGLAPGRYRLRVTGAGLLAAEVR